MARDTDRSGKIALETTAQIQNQITVWGHAFDHSNDLPLEWLEILDDTELEKCRRYRVHAERRRFAAARALLRLGLSHYTGHPPESWRFGLDGACKTRLLNHSSRLEFSVAHSDQVAMVAVSDVGPCGIDIERNDDLKLSYPLEGIFTGREEEKWEALPSPIKEREIIKHWTIKEAYAKYRGLGFHLNFLEFECLSAPEGVCFRTGELKVKQSHYFWTIVTREFFGKVPPPLEWKGNLIVS